MAELIGKLQELKALDQDLHLFCPRVGYDGGVYYDEDIAGLDFENEDDASRKERKEKMEEAEVRKWLTLDALKILAFDGEDAAPHKAWLIERLNAQLANCDVCIRRYHQSRSDLKHKLEEEYEEDEVAEFLKVVDQTDLDRIQGGLETGAEVLLKADPKQRGVKILPNEATYAFFEALSCRAFVKNDELLQQYFDTPFTLVQSRKRLRVQTCVPAMTRFLFSKNERRHEWGSSSWTSFKRGILKTEFDWAVREYLLEAMSRVQINFLDREFVPMFWGGARLVVDRLDKELITHCLRGLELDIYKLCLDHLQLDSDGFMDLLYTMGQLLEKSPADFWDAMGAISPVIIIEQVFNSPVLQRLLLQAKEDDEGQMQALEDMFSWIPALLSSIKPSNLAPPCRALANQCLDRLQSDKYSRASRDFCYRQGLHYLDHAFTRLNEGKTRSTFAGQATVTEFLELLGPYVELIVTGLKRAKSDNASGDKTFALSLTTNAFALECLSLEIEHQAILQKQPSPTGTVKPSPIWDAIIKTIDADNMEVATHMLGAGRNLVGLEKFFIKPDATTIAPNIKHFNHKFDLLSQTITKVVERLGDFDPERLNTWFKDRYAANPLIATLFSSEIETRQATVELLKAMSLREERREAIAHVLQVSYEVSVKSFAESMRQVIRKKIFAPIPSMIRLCADIVDVMCNSQDGILRSRTLSGSEAKGTLALWQRLWETLSGIFQTTEAWSNMGYDKRDMMNFCRDTMQFADQLFDQYSIFASALKEAFEKAGDDDAQQLRRELLGFPAQTMGGASKWLRLRDEFLSSKSTTLISKMLHRLHDTDIHVVKDTLDYIEKVLKTEIRTKLSMQQQAELQRAFETHAGKSLVKAEETAKQQKQGLLNHWISSGGEVKAPRPSKPDDEHLQLLKDTTRVNDAFKARKEMLKSQQLATTKRAQEAKAAEQAEFKRKRELEKEAKKKRDLAAIAAAKGALRGWSDQTAEAGSGLEGLGVLGKDHAAKGEGMMVSSDESEDDEDELDAELFGLTKTKKSGPKTNIVEAPKVQMPVKKRRVMRSIKDMRARLAPDLSSLHKTILSWDYYHNGDFPPKSRTDIYTKVPNRFRTAFDYQQTFEPLLTLEAWQGFVKAREENTFKPYEIRIVSRASVDAFQEVSSTMTHIDNRELNISEGDVVLMSKSKASSAQDPHCLARVFRITRKKDHLEVAYRVTPGNPLSSSLNPNAIVFGAKIQSITPLEREYGALLGLQYYDLCDEIINAKPSPLLQYSDKALEPLINNYKVNKAQAKAVKSAIDNDAFTLIQGPPGSGKTKTIVAIVGAILSGNLGPQGTAIKVPGQQVQTDAAPKKLLVCAPSNAAVDELVMRFKDGVKTLNGQHRQLNIVRLGRSDAINANVTDVTLEQQVNKVLDLQPNGNNAEATKKIFQEHQSVSEQLRQVRDALDAGEAKGDDLTKLKEDLDALKRRKTQLGTQIDNAKDQEKMQSRQMDMNRRRAQEKILGNAHVICATLSGSGHEMFQSLNIEFETVIVDEAAQCVEMSALIPLKYGCAKCILVGDPKQLPPTVFSKEAARFQYEQSLFVRMQGNHPDDVHLLDTQYRMHPEISVFPSQTFYEGRLLDGDDMAGLRKRPWHASSLLAPYLFFDVQGQHQAAPKGHSLINLAEIDVALQLYRRLISDYKDFEFKGKIGIITPYKSQLRELKNRFTQKYGPTITEAVEFNTTDAFQGRESEVIIFSCVRASPAGGIGFLQDIRRMNVGLTRAKSSLWVLGNSQSLVRGEFWRKLVEDARARKAYVQGNVMGMLQKHSSTFPALAYQAPPKAKQQPRVTSEADVKQEQRVKQGPIIKQEPNGRPYEIPTRTSSSDIRKEGLPHNGGKKRKASPSDDEDVEMKDPSESESASAGSVSRSVSRSASTSKQSTPVPDVKSDGAAKAPGYSGMNLAKPKIIRKRPKEVDPFIKRQPPKRPKN